MSSHLAKVHFSLSCYLWCLSDVCECVSVLLYNSWSTAITLLLGIRPVCVCVRCVCVRCVCEVCERCV